MKAPSVSVEVLLIVYNSAMNNSQLVYILKADGTREPFDPAKLVESLTNAGGSPEAVQKTLEHVIREISREAREEPSVPLVSTSDIYRHAFEILRKESLPVATKYSLRRALAELGPNGFPFERFVADIFKSWKYETLTDQVVRGGCVDHEVDVVAWNTDKLIMVEAKFHNEFGLKSDLKVALYVKARIDDLYAAGETFMYGGKKRALNEGWLVTNTKFTEQAIRYGQCAGLHMIGWNYPARGNLHDLITESHLHPFTCLATLSDVDKKSLLREGIVLCKEITPRVLKNIGLDQAKIAAVAEEINNVCGL